MFPETNFQMLLLAWPSGKEFVVTGLLVIAASMVLFEIIKGIVVNAVSPWAVQH